jgi:hypothetical protein
MMKVWCLLRDQFAHVKPVEECLGPRAQFVYDEAWDPEIMLGAQPDIVLGINDHHYEVACCLDAARTAKIPSLSLQDGILEWRCQYENPLFGYGGGAPQHQPVLADKIGCLGSQSARHIACWGNPAKVEVTGMPRLDQFLNRSLSAPTRPGKRILIMTAKKPWFTPEHKEVTLQAVRDLKEHLESLPGIELVWRISKSLEEEIKVENRLRELSAKELSEILGSVDAVVTTISTVILEAMLFDRPVAALDYHNVPRFAHTAWTISGPSHLGPVVAELLNPPANKMAFQRACLAESLRCDGPAAPRVAQLIEAMVTHAQSTRSSANVLEFPANLLGYHEMYIPASLPPLSDLYPCAPVFAEKDVERLQLRLARCENEAGRLRKQLKLQSKMVELKNNLFGSRPKTDK